VQEYVCAVIEGNLHGGLMLTFHS